MKNRVWMKSVLRVVTALAITAGFTVGISAAQSSGAPQATPPPGSPGFQVVYQCFTPNDVPVGLPKSPRSACLAACPAPNHCQACIFDHGAVDCG